MDGAFPGPMPLTAAHRYNADSRDDGFAVRIAAVQEDHGLAHCHYAGECSRVCPKGVDPAKAIQLMKRDALADLFGRRRDEPAGPVSHRAAQGDGPDEEPRAPKFTVRR